MYNTNTRKNEKMQQHNIKAKQRSGTDTVMSPGEQAHETYVLINLNVL